MKLLLLSLCLFGVVIANSDPSSPESIKHFSNRNLTRVIDREISDLEFKAKRYSVTYFVNLLNDLKAKFVRHRANVLELWTNANLPAGSDTLDRINYVTQYYRKEYELLEHEKRGLLTWTIWTQDLKYSGLRVAAQKIMDKNNTLPSPSEIVGQVKAIMEKENSIKKEVRDVTLTWRRMRTELSRQCVELKNTVWPYPMTYIQEWEIETLIKKMRNSTDNQVIQQADELENALNLTMAVKLEAQSFIPIDSNEKIDQVLAFEPRQILQNRALNKLFDAVKKSRESN